MLPIFKDQSQNLMLMQNKWASELNPILALPLNNMVITKGVELSVGVNVINHKLGATPQGWIITDIDGVATIYRSAPFSKLTLTLTSSAAVTVNLGVF